MHIFEHVVWPLRPPVPNLDSEKRSMRITAVGILEPGLPFEFGIRHHAMGSVSRAAM